MIRDIIHVGLTVSDLDRSVAFYRDVLGFAYQGELYMDGETTAKMFAKPGCTARVGYLKAGTDNIQGPPVELIQFTSHTPDKKPTDLFTTSISEICFESNDIWADYERLKAKGVEFLSEPQEFDFTADGFGKSCAVYLRDPDGLILELMQAR